MNSIELAKAIRKDCIIMAHGEHAVHIGGSLSMCDILAVLYNDILHFDIHNIKMVNRDRLIISKGHACTAVYAVLAEKGFITKEEFLTQYRNGSRISGHVSHKVPGIEVSTGSLGHGLPIACGMAYGAKIDHRNHHVFVILGDGECEEGTTWEASLFACHHQLENLTVIIDYNHLQSGASLEDTLGIKNLSNYIKQLGYDFEEIDGHNHASLKKALSTFAKNKPRCILAHTVKGKGVSYMENNPQYHSNKINDELFIQAMKELGDDNEK